MDTRNFATLIITLSLLILITGEKYRLSFERVETDYTNPKYFEEFSLNCTKYNRTETVVNVRSTLRVDLIDNVYMTLKAYRYVGNQYRFTGMSYGLNLCDAMKSAIKPVMALIRYSNITQCPMKKGTYVIYNSIPPGTDLPPHLPSGKFMIETEFSYNSEKFASFKNYISLDSVKN